MRTLLKRLKEKLSKTGLEKTALPVQDKMTFYPSDAKLEELIELNLEFCNWFLDNGIANRYATQMLTYGHDALLELQIRRGME